MDQVSAHRPCWPSPQQNYSLSSISMSEDTIIKTSEESAGRQDSKAGRKLVRYSYPIRDMGRTKMRLNSRWIDEYTGKIFEIVVPKEPEVILRKGNTIQLRKMYFPGYVLVNMIVTDRKLVCCTNHKMSLVSLVLETFQFPWLPEGSLDSFRKQMGVMSQNIKQISVGWYY